MQVISFYNTKLRTLCNAPDRSWLSALLNLSYVVDIYVLPFINVTALFAFLFLIASADSMGDAFAWFLAISLLNVMTAIFYILSQGDEFSLLATVGALDLYQCLLINSAWFVAIVDQLRKSDMKW